MGIRINGTRFSIDASSQDIYEDRSTNNSNENTGISIPEEIGAEDESNKIVNDTEKSTNEGSQEENQKTSKTDLNVKPNETTLCDIIKNCHLVSYNTRIYNAMLQGQVSVTKERKRHLASFPSTIHPYSDLRWYSDIFITIVLIICLIGQPVQIAFYAQSMANLDSAILSFIVSSIFFLDIALNFKTGLVPHENEQVILDPKIISLHYLKTWFFIDLISSIPYDSVYVTVNDIEGKGQLYFKFFRMLELLKVFRIARVMRYLSRIESAYEFKNVYTRIVNLIIMVGFLIHWLACLHYLVADMVNGPPNQPDPRSWVSQMEMWNNPVWEKYAHCILRALSNMACLGYGFVTPRTPEDVFATIGSILIGATCFALYIANISNIILELDSSRKNYNENLKQVMEYMQFKRMPKELQNRVKTYYEQRYKRNLFNEQEIMTHLSDVLRQDLQMFNCQQLVEQVPIFKGVQIEILQEIIAQLKFEVYLPKDVIIHANTVGDSMFFIEHGRVSILGKNGKSLNVLCEGSFFGEMSLITHERRVANVVALTSCDVYRLDRADFERVIHQYPEVYESIVEIAMTRQRKRSIFEKLVVRSDETVRKPADPSKRRSVQEFDFKLIPE